MRTLIFQTFFFQKLKFHQNNVSGLQYSGKQSVAK